MTSTRLLLPAAALLLVLAGCAQAQPTVTDDPVVAAPTDSAAPDPKPTATIPDSVGPLCFDDLGFTADEEQHGGAVGWPDPLTEDSIGVEPSCWVDQLGSDRNLFLAGWYGLDDAQYDTVNGPIEAALQAAGYQLTDDTNGVTQYELDPGDGQPISHFLLTRSDGYYEVSADFKGRA